MIDNLSLGKYLSLYEISIGLVISTLLINLLGLCLPLSIFQVYNQIIAKSCSDPPAVLLLAAAFLGAVILAEVGLKMARAYVSTWGDAKLNFNIGERIFSQTLNTNLLKLNDESTGKRLEQINALDSLRQLIGGQAITNFVELPFSLLYLAIISYINLKLALLVFALQLSLALYLYAKKKTFCQSLTAQNSHQQTSTNFLLESLANIHTIKSLGMESLHNKKFAAISKQIAIDELELNLQNNSLARAASFANQLCILAVVTFGANLVITQNLTIGALACCTLLAIKAMQPLAKFINIWQKYHLFNLAKEQYLPMLKLPQTFPAQQTIKADENMNPKVSLKGKISVKNINFKYETHEPWLLERLNLEVSPGEIIAVAKGQGKSTLLSLLAGLIPPTTGNIVLDNEYVLSYDSNIHPHADNYRQQIVLISPDSKLFTGTVLDNLTGFAANPDLAMVEQVITELGIKKVLATLPNGLQTQVGRAINANVSRGIKQQLLIARAFISKPKIILFDDACISLDLEAQQLLATYLQKVKGQFTFVMATNNSLLLNLADRVFTINNGNLNYETSN